VKSSAEAGNGRRRVAAERADGTEPGWLPRQLSADVQPKLRLPVSSHPALGNFWSMLHHEQASPLHKTMLEVLHEAGRRGISHDKYSLPVCKLLLTVHAPAGEPVGVPCRGCSDGWPCKTVLGVLGGLDASGG
jgi:hypothetical protein